MLQLECCRARLLCALIAFCVPSVGGADETETRFSIHLKDSAVSQPREGPLGLRPGIEIRVLPAASAQSGDGSQESDRSAESVALPQGRTAAPRARSLEGARPASPTPSPSAGQEPRTIDEFQFQFLTEDGLRFRNNLPVEFVSTENRGTKSELTAFLNKRSVPRTPSARSLERVAGDEPGSRLEDLTEAVVVREYLRRKAVGEPASITVTSDAAAPFAFNGVAVTGGRDGSPLIIGGEPVMPTPLERFPGYRDNQRSFSANARIYHGQFTDDFLDVVLLGGAGNAICTGTLIAPDMVLSAAHCACDFNFREARFGSSKNHSSAIAIAGDPIIFDPAICEAGDSHAWDLATWHKGDVALYKLERTAEFEPRVLAPAALVDQAPHVMLVGFGKTEANPIGGFKYKAEVPIATNACLSEQTNDDGVPAPEVFGCAEHRELVAASKDLRDTCAGDSGGPAFVRLTDNDGQTKYFLAGVTSRSVLNPTAECGSGGIYVRVHLAVADWLRAHVPSLAFADETLRVAALTTDSR